MRSILSLVFLLCTLPVLAAEPICVRNWRSGDKYACDQFPNTYTWVYPKDTTAVVNKVCARIYSPFFCDEAKEYVEVEAKDGTTICVMNYNQPPVANYCESLPTFYQYILSEAP